MVSLPTSGPLRLPPRRRPASATAAVAAVVAVALIGAAAAALLRSPLRRALPGRVAIADARADPLLRAALAGASITGARAVALDSQTVLVTFYSGARTQAQALVAGDGRVSQATSFLHQAVPYGDWVAYTPVAIALLAALLVLCGAVVPLRRARNLDLAVILALNAGILLFAARYVRMSLLTTLAPLCYLLARGAWIGLRGGVGIGVRSDGGSVLRGGVRAGGEAPSRPLLEWLLGSWPARRRVRLARLVVLALALSYLMLCASSPGTVDVAYAVMEGATRILEGVLPYGHLPGDVFHGDTYPIFSYALYAPLAALEPVRSIWSSLEGELVLCALAALAAAWCAGRVAAGCARSAGTVATAAPDTGPAAAPDAGPAAGERAGEEGALRAAICLLSFPGLLITASSGSSDIVVALILAGALAIWRRPALCSAALAFGALFKVVPGALLALALAPLRGRRLAAALAGVAAVCAAAAALLVGLGGAGAPLEMLHAVSYQLSRGESQSLWSAAAPVALQPIGEGIALGLIAAFALALRRRPQIALDRRAVAALAMAVVICLQIVANYWAPLYVAWFAPLAVLALLVDRRTPPPAARGGACAPTVSRQACARGRLLARSQAKPPLSVGR
jgi:hypothetical protein